MLIANKPHVAWSYLTYGCCALSFLILPFFPSTGRNLFYVSGYIAFFCFIFNVQFYLKNKFNLILPALFFAFSMINLLWLVLYKAPGDYINVYRSYMTTSRLLIATAFVLLIANNERIDVKRYVLLFCLAAGIVINFYAIYQSIWLKYPRIELSFDRATIVAYILTAINLMMLQSILMLKHRFYLLYYAATFILTYSTIIFTGTRAAMLFYPVAVVLCVMATKDIISHRRKLSIVLLLPILLAASSLIFQNKIEKRITDFQNNVKNVNVITQENSIFSRLWMQDIAIRTGNESPLGQSAEKRGEEALAIIAKEPKLYNAKRYLTVHLHNEILETYSLKGIFGTLMLIAIYCMLLFSSFRPVRNPMLFGVSLSLIIYGLSDVILFSSEGTIIFSLAIIISTLSIKNNHSRALSHV